MKHGKTILLSILLPAAVALAAVEEPVDVRVMEKIRSEGFQRSRVMDIAGFMTDVLGPRFSNSAGYTEAAFWARDLFRKYGISAEAEAYGEVGPGWENAYTSVHMLTPRYMPFIAYTKPYTRSTAGKISAEAVFVDTTVLFSRADLEPFAGKLKGRIVLVKPARKLVPNFAPQAARLSDAELADMAELRLQPEKESDRRAYGSDAVSREREPLSEEIIQSFFAAEGVAALVEPGGPQGGAPMDKGLVHVSAPRPLPAGARKPLPAVIAAPEHYNRVVRILGRGIPVTMEVETRVEWEEGDLRDFNVIAEIPGTDLADEIVMIGGHYDGEPTGTGATDNAAGCAAVVEAMRILKEIGVRPRRTIRAALWGCEEAGHLGSRAYVAQHFGDPENGTIRPGHAKLSVYFNMDWYGRFRGIYLQGNDLVRPIFEAWMTPFHDVGMTCLSPGNTGGTDHMGFVRAGLPGFQFIQDDLEFFTTTFHTNMDVYDRLVPEDLKQAAVILSAFAYNAATRDGMLPRTPHQARNSRRWHK